MEEEEELKEVELEDIDVGIWEKKKELSVVLQGHRLQPLCHCNNC